MFNLLIFYIDKKKIGWYNSINKRCKFNTFIKINEINNIKNLEEGTIIDVTDCNVSNDQIKILKQFDNCNNVYVQDSNGFGSYAIIWWWKIGWMILFKI